MELYRHAADTGCSIENITNQKGCRTLIKTMNLGCTLLRKSFFNISILNVQHYVPSCKKYSLLFIKVNVIDLDCHVEYKRSK